MWGRMRPVRLPPFQLEYFLTDLLSPLLVSESALSDQTPQQGAGKTEPSKVQGHGAAGLPQPQLKAPHRGLRG